MTFEEACFDRFKRNLKRLNKLVELNAPPIILAREFDMLGRSATGAFGKDLALARLEHDLVNIRNRVGYCQYCDNQVAVESTYPPICEHCDARIDKELDEMEKRE